MACEDYCLLLSYTLKGLVQRPASNVMGRTKVEILKEKSDFLRHPLMEQLVTEESSINEEAGQLMKFHGSYQQDDRSASWSSQTSLHCAGKALLTRRLVP